MGQTGHWDVIVLGAGIAGLNALAVASGYVGRDGRLLLADRREDPGGMWNDTYDYVRLHQPHPFFTAADIRWTQGHPPAHLASKAEVLAHFHHCLEVVSQRTRLDTRLGAEYLGHTERDGIVEVTLRTADGTVETLTADRLVKAFGHDIAVNPALPLSSTRVHSVSPNAHDMQTGPISEDSAPVWVVGGGKTGMDTALALVRAQPHRDVRVLVGAGTSFFVREEWFPSGLRRWTGKRVNQYGVDYTLQFDGANEADVQRWFLQKAGHAPVDEPRDFVLGIVGRDEMATLRERVKEFAKEYLADVVDTADGPVLHLRSGATRPLADGTWIVNCTGYVGKGDQAYEPHASPSGRVVSINDRAAVTHLTSFAGYFLTHALMRDLLPLEDLYELDLQALGNDPALKPTVGIACFTASLHNFSVFFDALPLSVFSRNGLDYDGWFPKPRVLGGALRFAATHHRMRARQRAALDVLGTRGVHSGPVSSRTA